MRLRATYRGPAAWTLAVLLGGCLRPPSEPPAAPEAAPGLTVGHPSLVSVSARPAVLSQASSHTICKGFLGIGGNAQHLEALIPSPDGPLPVAPGRAPERQTFCGEVRGYEIFNEWGDPRDITIDLIPAPGYEHFLENLLGTECTDAGRFQAVDDARCDEAACRLAAATGPSRAARCIHAELTPAEQFHGEDDRFLPISWYGRCGHGWGCASDLEPAGAGARGREVCVHGPYVLDHGKTHGGDTHRAYCCPRDPTHDRPEIHPFDAIWFRDGDRSWIFGVFQDDSNRYSAPYCGNVHNGNEWSRPPRDLSFRFPLPAGRSRCVRITNAIPGRDGGAHRVRALNVTTAGMPGLGAESHELRDDNGQVVVEVREDPEVAAETHVTVEGGAAGGQLVVRVAVGCNDREGGMSCTPQALAGLDPPGRHDGEDVGSGFFYGRIIVGDGPCR